MTTFIHKHSTCAVAVIGSILIAGLVGHAQTTTQPPKTFAGGGAPQASKADDQAEREKIWNSPSMLRARAWLQDYCSKSAKVTPEMAKRYQQELENMSASQMQLYLLKFNEQEEQLAQQQAMFQQAEQARLRQAMAVHKQEQQAYANINAESTAAANNEQQQINVQRENTEENAQDRLYNMGPAPAWTGPGYGGYGGWGGYAPGGIHYHYHLYPAARP